MEFGLSIPNTERMVGLDEIFLIGKKESLEAKEESNAKAMGQQPQDGGQKQQLRQDLLLG